MVARVAASRLLVGLGLAFKIGAGHIVKQELEPDAKPIPVTLLQMGAKLVLVCVEHIQTTVEP
jgi:hypothetical protein